MNDNPEILECMEDPTECSGPVELHSLDPGRSEAFPRCEKHWGRRLDRYWAKDSMERYANSDVVPEWFDPTYAGETW